ncbi:hypothetical protein O181_015539 [Austropuccinia psidii MF-1]|uniref:Subtelomeric hrmA-associated cluster protein AFUB-079030/YDR124W-like helical bundle domain-containing protein n=1 Tax=Austropuccinia psidii MF-1 TaxID=1389203 RepID=A0A9Q3GQY0_9BASI|nr:hypothetical protein [Austropuccinia psidii MF-1]
MPRIPTRTTPYDTPTRQHRHFKNKRDQILRALGRSSYINGSQFAIVWVSARGEAETYASPVLQSLLDSKPGQPSLFTPEILERAKDAAMKVPSELKGSEIFLEHIKKPQITSQVESADSPLEDNSQKVGLSQEAPEPPASEQTLHDSHVLEAGYNTNIEESASKRRLLTRVLSSSPSSRSPKNTESNELSEILSLPTDTNTFDSYGSKQMMSSQGGLRSETDASDEKCQLSSKRRFSGVEGYLLPSHNEESGDTKTSGSVPQNEFTLTSPCTKENATNFGDLIDEKFDRKKRPFKGLPRRVDTPTENSNVVYFQSARALGRFLEGKFCQLQQNTCKLVCKAWIKVVEPKKQTKFPYRSGDSGKPDWWPREVIHREPDHLLKPERMRLMLAVLGAGRVPVGRLELASAEIAAFIPPDKMAILSDIYKVAKEEERLRSFWPKHVKFVPFNVELGNKTGGEIASKTIEIDKTEGSALIEDTVLEKEENLHYLQGKEITEFSHTRAAHPSENAPQPQNISLFRDMESWETCLSDPQQEYPFAKHKPSLHIMTPGLQNEMNPWPLYPESVQDQLEAGVSARNSDGTSIASLELFPGMSREDSTQYCFQDGPCSLLHTGVTHSDIGLGPPRRPTSHSHNFKGLLQPDPSALENINWMDSDVSPSNDSLYYYDHYPEKDFHPLGDRLLARTQFSNANILNGQKNITSVNESTISKTSCSTFPQFSSFSEAQLENSLAGFESPILHSNIKATGPPMYYQHQETLFEKFPAEQASSKQSQLSGG